MSEVDPLSAQAAAAAGVPEHEAGLGSMMLESPRHKKSALASAASSSSPLESSEPLCWGAQLRGDPSFCTPGFTGGTAHFKNKFCPACKAGSFEIPVSHIRALPRSWNPESASLDLKLSLSNGHSVGFWKTLPDGEGRFRFVNNTLDCAGPQLVVFLELVESFYYYKYYSSASQKGGTASPVGHQLLQYYYSIYYANCNDYNYKYYNNDYNYECDYNYYNSDQPQVQDSVSVDKD